MSCCDCRIDDDAHIQKSTLLTLLLLNAVMFAVELIIGILADSSGVLADSLDMLADAFVYALSFWAVGRASHHKRRAAHFSGYFQMALALLILSDAIRRAFSGSEPHSLLMFVVACFALLVNAYCLAILARHRKGEVHMRASWIFTRSDVIANAGVIAASLLVWMTRSRWPDLLVGMSISAVVLKGGWEIITSTQDAPPACRSASDDTNSAR